MQNRLYNELCSLEVLKRAWHLVRNDARKGFIRDSFRYSDFGFSLDENLLRILDSLKRECYYPKPLLEIDVPKSSLTVRPGSVPEIEDRIVTFAIVYLIAPRLDKKLPEGVYSYRLKPQSTRDQLFRDHVYIPVNPATDSGSKRPPIGAKRRWRVIIHPCGRNESRVSGVSAWIRPSVPADRRCG